MSRKTSMLAAAIAAAPADTTPQPQETAPKAPAKAPERPHAELPPSLKPGSYQAPSRAGKMARTHYLPPAYWDTLAELAFRSRDERGKRVPQERLLAEALNLLFLKHNVPAVRD